MGLTDRLRRGTTPVVGADEAVPAEADTEAFHQVKGELHRTLVDRLDFKSIEKLDAEDLRKELRDLLARMMEVQSLPLNRIERERVIAEVIHEVTGLGPLEPLLADPNLSDILVNTYNVIYVEKEGKLQRSPVRFRDNDHLLHIINRIVARIGRRVDESSPMVDARLADGSRVNAIIPPLAVDGPLLSIRRFGRDPLKAADLLANGTVTPEMMEFMKGCVKARLNVLLSGGTGTGKTTMLNALSALIPDNERIITVEDAAELQLQQPHVCRLETRPPNIEGRGEVVIRDLVRNCLRMRPDRIIVGEVRGAEVLDMLQAMNTGHDGSMTTVHANSPRDALTRLMSMISMAEVSFSEAVMAQMLSRAIHILVQVQRFSDGRRRLGSISEITGTEGNIITMQEVFAFRQTGVGEEGRVLGEYVGLGVPRCLDRIERAGMKLDHAMFSYKREAR
jgi:pilus assembly protein CpaF